MIRLGIHQCFQQHNLRRLIISSCTNSSVADRITAALNQTKKERKVSSHMMDGASVFAQSLATQGVQYMFGVVGIPVIEIAVAAQQAGINFIGMRNEQAASYAASAVGYLTKIPAVCLVVSGPGLIHAFAGMCNAKENCWPMIVVGGACDRFQEQRGAFQELPQVELARPYCKFSARPNNIWHIPFYVEKAVRSSIQGRPGVSYIDLPGDLIIGSEEESKIKWLEKTPVRFSNIAPKDHISKAVKLMMSASKPLVIIGKGAAYGRAEAAVRSLIEQTGFPFLPTPMGKGVVPDNHPQCVAAARSQALQEADVILLVGARLNWILHFGVPPRFNKDVKIIHVEVTPEEIGNNIPCNVALCGDVELIVAQLLEEYRKSFSLFQFSTSEQWWLSLKDKISTNVAKTNAMISASGIPMNFYKMYDIVRNIIPPDCIIVNEGANTMDIGRTMLPNILPRHRLDAGSFGTMGVGSGFAISAALVQLILGKNNNTQPKKVVCIQGDSAFGFGGMELETSSRYKLPIVFIIANNNGIYSGLDGESWDEMLENSDQESLGVRIPPVSLDPHCKYEKLISAFNCSGYEVNTPAELANCLELALQETEKPSLIHVHIETTSQRKPQEFDWLTKSNL